MSSDSQRSRARQNLLVATVNAALERGLITLACEPVGQVAFEFQIAGEPVLASIRDATGRWDEVSVKALVRPTVLGRKFVHAAIFSEWRRFAEARVTELLERRSGRYLQTGWDYHGTRELTRLLSQQDIEPLGFGVRPTASGYDFHKEFAAV